MSIQEVKMLGRESQAKRVIFLGGRTIYYLK